MLNEYDVVIANKDLSQSVAKGTKGAIMLIAHKDKEHYKYEVEFVDKYGDTLELLTVDELDLDLVNE